jgi:hypothetical protein
VVTNILAIYGSKLLSREYVLYDFKLVVGFYYGCAGDYWQCPSIEARLPEIICSHISVSKINAQTPIRERLETSGNAILSNASRKPTFDPANSNSLMIRCVTLLLTYRSACSCRQNARRAWGSPIRAPCRNHAAMNRRQDCSFSTIVRQLAFAEIPEKACAGGVKSLLG